MRRGPSTCVLVVLAAMASACVEHPMTPPQAAPRDARTSLAPLSIERPTAEESRGSSADLEPTPSDAPLLLGLKSAVIQTGAKSVGSTSVVFKVPLDGGLDGAFKPETRRHGERYRGEIAAYRLSRALGLENVPPSIPRAAKVDALIASTKSSVMVKLIREEIVPREDGRVPGAMIAWLRGLSRLPIENDPLWSAWGEWLSMEPPRRSIELRVPKGQQKRLRDARPLAPQISNLVLFDHLTGNRDRWSGNNVLVDVTGTRVVFLDNNLAFDPVLDVAATKRRTAVLHRVERFSRAFVAKVRGLSRASLEAALGHDDLGTPLLTESQVDALVARRAEVLGWVDATIAKYGADRALAFD